MAIFNEDYIESLNEMKTKEEYRRRSLKKKYNFVPDKGEKDVGTITDEKGKKYKVDASGRKITVYEDDYGNKVQIKPDTMAMLDDKDSKIYINKKLFKLKGSNKSERRDAILNHEIGHQNLHNTNPKNKTVDAKNYDPKVMQSVYRGMAKDQFGIDVTDKDQFSHDYRKEFHNDLGMKNYAIAAKEKRGTTKPDPERRKALDAAKKYEKMTNHQNASEYEADRFAANRTSDSAVKKGVREEYKHAKKENKNDPSKKVLNKLYQADMDNRSKALKDETMKKSDVYK